MQVASTPIQEGKVANAGVYSYFDNTTIEVHDMITGKAKWIWFYK
jgi:hypothetical protein